MSPPFGNTRIPMKIALFFAGWLVLSFVVAVGFGRVAETSRRRGGLTASDSIK